MAASLCASRMQSPLLSSISLFFSAGLSQVFDCLLWLPFILHRLVSLWAIRVLLALVDSMSSPASHQVFVVNLSDGSLAAIIPGWRGEQMSVRAATVMEKRIFLVNTTARKSQDNSYSFTCISLSAAWFF